MRIRGILLAFLLLGCLAPTLTATAQVSDQDKTFLKNSTADSIDEIDLGKLALEKSKNADVRMFATRMIHDHTMLINSMKPFAARWNVTLPDHMDADGDAKYAELKLLTGDTFDKHYLLSMQAAHQGAQQKFDDEIASTHDARYKAAVEKGRAVVHAHLELATRLVNKYHLS